MVVPEAVDRECALAFHWVVMLQDASGIEIVVVGIAIFFGFILACLILIWFSAKVSGMTMVEFAKKYGDPRNGRRDSGGD